MRMDVSSALLELDVALMLRGLFKKIAKETRDIYLARLTQHEREV